MNGRGAAHYGVIGRSKGKKKGKREKRKKKKREKKKKFKTMGIEGERRSLVKNEGMGRGRGREGGKPNEAKSFKL